MDHAALVRAGARGYDRAMRGAVIVLVVLGGCVLDPYRHTRPARLEIGANTRGFSAAPAAARSPDVAAIESAGASGGGGEPARQQFAAVSGSVQFTMGMAHRTYLGGELEAGALDERGSNLAAGYGVFGVEQPVQAGTLGVELAGGYRSIRHNLDDGADGHAVLEPRLRGQLWLGAQVTLGAIAGASIGDGLGWVAGIQLGVHSRPH